MDDPTPPPIPSDAPAGEWVLEGDDEGLCWVWEEDVQSPRVEAVLAEGDAQIAALQADVSARRQVCRRTHGAAFSETLGIGCSACRRCGSGRRGDVGRGHGRRGHANPLLFHR